MKKFRVSVPYVVWVSVEVDAEDQESAIEASFEEAFLTGYCGNGGTDKLVGVSGGASVEAGDTPIDFGGVGIEVEEI